MRYDCFCRMHPVYYPGVRIKILFRFLLNRLRGYHGDYLQDRWVIRDVFRGKRGGYFVDIGAHDGFTASNTWVLEKKHGWKGICIEPNARSFSRLQACRSCVCVQTCVGDHEGETDFLEAAGVWGGMVSAYPPGRRDVLKRYLTSRSILRNGEWKTVRKPVQRLETILRTHHAPHVIEYLSVDTEGSEFDILRDFPFDEYTFLAITVEHNSVSPARSDIRSLLERNGYVCWQEGGIDDFYIHSSIRGNA